MVYQQQQQRGGGGRERKRGNTRCLGCGYGCGQFGVEYITDEEHGSGRGYCSLDCYTSAKVREKARRDGEGGNRMGAAAAVYLYHTCGCPRYTGSLFLWRRYDESKPAPARVVVVQNAQAQHTPTL